MKTIIVAMTTMCGDIFDATGEIRPGGEALNFAAIASEYPHVEISLVGAIGDDECGREILKSIQNKKIDQSCIHVVAGGTTACNRTYLTEQGDRYYKEDSWNGGVYNTFRLTDKDREKLKEADIVFLNFECTNFDEVLELKRKLGFQLAVDFDVARDLEKLESIAADVDFFFISGEESLLPVFRDWSLKYDGIFNVTLAEKGSVSFQKGQEYRTLAVPVEEIIDTTGCGDSYHSAFICFYVKERDILKAMEEGSRAASETLTHLGGFTY